MKYAEMASIEAGIRFKTQGGLTVQTTGVTLHIESTKVYVHEVAIVEGTGQGNKYLHNLDYAQKV